MKRLEVNREELSPMMKQYMEVKDQYEDAILFYRLGDFYEMFFEDALLASNVLELTLTGKSCGLKERVPMCGIPFHSYLPYLEKLVNQGYKVAVCEQLSDPNNKGVVERGVVQVVTKGTLMDNSALDEKSNNFIGSIYDFTHCYVLSYIDISTGEVFSSLIDYNCEKLINEVIRLDIKEIIVNDKIDRQVISVLRDTYGILITIQNELLNTNDYDYIYADVKDVRVINSLKHLLYYLNATKMGYLAHLQKVVMVDKRNVLELDLYTKRNLELVENLRLKERTFSLLWLLDKTKTAFGSRYLKQMIENPLVDKEAIERRYDFISVLLTEFILKEDLKENLAGVYDLERLAGRISYGNANARDFIQLKNSLKQLPALKKILTSLNYDREIETLDELYDLLEQAIIEDAPLGLKEGGIIKDGYSKELDELRSLSNGGKDFILKLEQQEKERTGIKNLKVGYNKVFGYFIEVSKGNIPMIKDEYQYIRKQTLVNAERYITPLLKEKENLILNAEEKSYALEYELFTAIRNIVREYIPRIQKIASVLAEVDFLQSLAQVAEERGYVRPTLTLDKNLKIVDGRHPVVEVVSKKAYVPNDVLMDAKTSILLITGPNMSGKSTYMRMLAIIIIMAQMGSFVPCKEATLPIFDKIFTRIGASDDLVSGESTFMVEMKEANNAVSNATDKSLILFDELGRGTATYDGMSLAQAILEYIHDEVKAKTLFSTHYHELTSLEKNLSHLKNVHVSAKEDNGSITFLHKIKNGPVDKSYGIHVASLVNLPTKIIERASEILNIYENKKGRKEVYEQTSLQLDFSSAYKEKEEAIIKKLKEINPLEITPIDAMNLLYELKKEASDEDK